MPTNEDILDKILVNYFDKATADEYRKILTKKSLLKEEISAPLSPSDYMQLSSEIGVGSSSQAQIDLLITYASKNLSEIKLLELLLYLGENFQQQGDLNLAIRVQEYVIKIGGKNPRFENISAYALLALGGICRRQAKWKESTAYVNRAKKIFKKQKDFKGLVWCENLLGTICGDRGDLVGAENHFEKSLTNLKDKVDLALVGALETNIGILHNMQGNYDLAVTYYKRGLVKFEQLEDMIKIARTRHNIGMLYLHKKEYDAALSEFDTSISVALKVGNMPTLAISYLSKAYIYAQLENYPLANALADRSMEISYKIDDRLSIADIYKIKGIIERNQKNFSAAENYFFTSLRINKELKNFMNEAETSYEIGLLYSQMGNKKEAARYLRESMEYYEKINEKKMSETIENLLKEMETSD